VVKLQSNLVLVNFLESVKKFKKHQVVYYLAGDLSWKWDFGKHKMFTNARLFTIHKFTIGLTVFLVKFCKILQDSERFWEILRESERFWDILRYSERFWKILKDSERFWKILKDSSSKKLCMDIPETFCAIDLVVT